MALILDATAGGANANTYCILAVADTYHAERLHRDDWDNAASEIQNAALIWSTRIEDRIMDWYGSKYTSTQSLRWPRTGVVDPDGYDISYTVIPTFLQHATAELARHLIVQDREAEPDEKGFKRIQAGTVRIDPDKFDRISTLPKSVRLIVRPYGTYGYGGSRILYRV